MAAARPACAREPGGDGGRPFWVAPLVAFLLSSLLIGAIGAFAYRSAKQSLARAVDDSLESVTRLKSVQIEEWLEENREDFQAIASNSDFVGALSAWRAGGMREDRWRRQLLDYMNRRASVLKYLEMSVHSPADGSLLLGTGIVADTATVRQRALAAVPKKVATMEDFHPEPTTQRSGTRLGFYYAVRAEATAPPLAVVHVAIDPAAMLLPIAQEWPTLTRSSETLLLRREGNDVVFLHALRHSPGIGPMPRLPVGKPDSIVAMAVAHSGSTLRGVDYRGMPVLAYALAVEGTPWYLMAKIDEAEVFAKIDSVAATAAAATLLVLLAGCAWWGARSYYTIARYRAERESAVLAKRIGYLARYANDCITLCDLDGHIFEANDRCMATYGYTRAEMLALSVPDLRAPQQRAEAESMLHRVATEGSLIYETEHCRKDGSTFPVEISGCLVDIDGTSCLQAIIRDITERKRLETERVEHVQRVAEISRRVVSVQEQERRRISREMHDRTGANLAAIGLNLKTLSKELPPATMARCDGILKETGELLADTVSSLRELCAELRPAILDYAGFIPALEDLGKHFGRRTGLDVRVSHNGFAGRFSPDVESLLYRIVQEALTNCAKHANARSVGIGLTRLNGRGVLSVVDDGMGFDPDQVGHGEREPGLGLLTMRERAEFAGGRFSIHSSPGAGTEIRVEVAVAADVRSAA